MQSGGGNDVAARRHPSHEGLALAHVEHARRGALLGADVPRARAARARRAIPDDAERRPHWPEFVPMFAAQIASVTRAELEPRLREEGCIFSFFASPPEVLADPAVGRQRLRDGASDAPEAAARGRARAVRRRAPVDAARRARPRGHTAEVLAELGYDEQEIAPCSPTASSTAPAEAAVQSTRDCSLAMSPYVGAVAHVFAATRRATNTQRVGARAPALTCDFRWWRG